MRPAPAPNSLRWYWALYVKPGTLRTDNRVTSLDGAKAEFEASWKQRKAWAKMEEMK